MPENSPKMKRFVIKDSTLIGFADEVNLDGFDVEKYSKQRVSRILPVNPFKYFSFVVLRRFSDDDSKIASWTRKWRGPWNVFIDDRRYGPFETRGEAISFEKEEIYKLGKFDN